MFFYNNYCKCAYQSQDVSIKQTPDRNGDQQCMSGFYNIKLGFVYTELRVSAGTYSQLKIKESFHTEQLKPEFNKQVEHVSLSLHF